MLLNTPILITNSQAIELKAYNNLGRTSYYIKLYIPVYSSLLKAIKVKLLGIEVTRRVVEAVY